ncbi:hypothetical protein SELMODRAFT_270878 [Selaginella moellendorffii]|uniref:Amidase domain-containing protein n=2 Tax=Selaginella moellendorffii TaxID=88036 RepID=D8RIG4_SELML|nr:fatty acid amide hydrolase [Selaginella moellendorffii]EFJ28089.1 hypothetical protein SELMODRAFT_270878 [Selaginella moellendorffii]|eukprot:XP_002970763.1 fatty acid amide hydrolase [Selaginella moellendorffii]
MGIKWLEYTPVERMSTKEDSDVEYLYVEVKAPRMAGLTLKCFTWMMESTIGTFFLKPKLKRDNLITKTFVQSRYDEPPMFQPHFSLPEPEDGVLTLDSSLSVPGRVARSLDCLGSLHERKAGDGAYVFRHWTIRDYTHAYKSGRLMPTQVAERFLSAVDESIKGQPGMSIFIAYNPRDILRQAEESTSRYKQGKPLSVLDGVPIAVKDELDCLPYDTTGGTKWMSKVRDVKEDAACVSKLRACGAMLVGKTNMHELGQGTTGINPHYGATRNPYNKAKASGGSSGGSAAAVACGLCPAALGVDGGGSVRMPAALCGIVGLKGTFGRISSHGVLPLNWTVGSVGVLAATVEDTLIMYAAVQGHLSSDRIVSIPPQVTLPQLNRIENEAIGGLKLAKYTEWFDDSDPDVKDRCYAALSKLQKRYGCKTVEVTIPELEEMRLAHFVTIGCECYSSIGIQYENVGVTATGADIRVGFALYKSFTNTEYLSAQRMRYRQMYYHMEIFKNADVIVTPTTAATAPSISLDALECGELNYVYGAKLMRYQIAGNFIGLPAISVPVGFDQAGMPIGIQLIGKPWSEATLLRLAYVIEGLCAAESRRPEVLFDLLL